MFFFYIVLVFLFLIVVNYGREIFWIKVMLVESYGEE